MKTSSKPAAKKATKPAAKKDAKPAAKKDAKPAAEKDRHIVYILSNAAFPQYVKIGKTKFDINTRMRQLDSTGVPISFECEFVVEVENEEIQGQLETTLHKLFKDQRVRQRREFFEIGVDKALEAINLYLLGNKPYTIIQANVDDYMDQEDKVAVRKTRISFDTLSIPPGTILKFKDDSSYTCEVINSNKVLFEGQEMTLSGAAKMIFEKKGISKISYAGPTYWLHPDDENITLYEYRKLNNI